MIEPHTIRKKPLNIHSPALSVLSLCYARPLSGEGAKYVIALIVNWILNGWLKEQKHKMNNVAVGQKTLQSIVH